MINIRYGLFETNSSSVHSMTLLTQDEYEKWESGNYYIDLYEGKILTKGDVETIVSEYINHWGLEYPIDKEEFDEILYYKDIYSPESYEEYTEGFKTFDYKYNKDGHIIYAVGYYGRDG